MVMLCKGLAWAVSLGSFRGGPTFPAIYLGAAGGIAASHLPGMSLTPGVAVGMGVMVVAFLKLPLSAIVIATALTASAGLAVGPLIIIGVVVAYLATLGLEGRLGTGAAPAGTPTAPPFERRIRRRGLNQPRPAVRTAAGAACWYAVAARVWARAPR